MQASSINLVNSFGRFWRSKVMRFGVYDLVVPVETTPSRVVPDHIPKPRYVTEGLLPNPPTSPEIKDVNQLHGMRRSCKLASKILAQVHKAIQPGNTTDDIDALVHELTIEAGAYPSPLHYKGFPKSVCTSVNNVAAHGIPDLRPLQDGDIINVDITVFYKGFHGDCSKTFPVGNVDDKGLHLIQITEECLDVGIKVCGPGVPFCEIGTAIQRYAKRNRYTVFRTFEGHGIGEYFHGPPQISHVANRYPGLMKPGMTFTIEPCVTPGDEVTILMEDMWTLITEDGSRAAQAEHTVLITENGAEILT